MQVHNPSLEINGRRVSEDSPVYIIAEIGVNHNGDLKLARRLVEEAKKAGADAVKFQTFKASDLALPSAARAQYQQEKIGSGSQQDMLRALELSFEDFGSLREQCQQLDIDFISTAFDPRSLQMVLSLNPACIKWPSGEITNFPLLKEAARAQLPLLLSTGMATMAEIAAAQEFVEASAETVILQCVSNYPAKIEHQNFNVLRSFKAAFGRPVGYSDHTIGPFAAIAARALGMCVLEKHLTLDCDLPGPDHAASIEPSGFLEMVTALRKIEKGLGDGVKRPLPGELEVKAVARKGLVYASALPAGHVLNAEDLIAKRPETGFSPALFELVLGRTLKAGISTDQPVDISDVE